MTTWSVPPLWTDKTVAILASGPSMSPSVAQAVRRVPVAVTNSTFRLAPWADLLYAADAAWWRANPDAFDFEGIKVCAQDEIPGLYTLKNTGKTGFDADPRCIRTGGNSGYQAVHVAIQAGARRVLLCGFDMRPGHWHGVSQETAESTYATWRERFQTLADAVQGVEILNCTPGSALKCFPFADLAEALNAD